MQEISNYTFTYEAFPEAMGMLWKRMLIESKQVGPAWLKAVVRFRIRKIHISLDLPDPDPLERGTDPDPGPSIIKQK
jgi:hypothetical protein